MNTRIRHWLVVSPLGARSACTPPMLSPTVAVAAGSPPSRRSFGSEAGHWLPRDGVAPRRGGLRRSPATYGVKRDVATLRCGHCDAMRAVFTNGARRHLRLSRGSNRVVESKSGNPVTETQQRVALVWQMVAMGETLKHNQRAFAEWKGEAAHAAFACGRAEGAALLFEGAAVRGETTLSGGNHV